MIIYKNKKTQKNFILLENSLMTTSFEKGKFITPEGRIKHLEKSLFEDEPVEFDDISLPGIEISPEQALKLSQYRKFRKNDFYLLTAKLLKEKYGFSQALSRISDARLNSTNENEKKSFDSIEFALKEINDD